MSDDPMPDAAVQGREAGSASYDTIKGKKSLSLVTRRHVAFASKCIVILPEYDWAEDDGKGEDYFSSKSQKHGSNIRRRLSQLRSKASHAKRASEKGDEKAFLPFHSHQKTKAYMPAALSPSLPVNRAPIERKKLVSPPPPAREMSPSPLESAPPMSFSEPFNRKIQEQMSPQQSSPSDTSAAQSPPAGPSEPKSVLARPQAVRKPLALGAEASTSTLCGSASKLTLRVPPIVESICSSPSAVKTHEVEAKAILEWTDDEETGTSSSEADHEESPLSSPQVFFEEEINGECACLDCEGKMREALEPDYTAPWTRKARRKYLADHQEQQSKERKSATRPPIWLKSEDAEQDTLALRSIKADEVDAKRGDSKDAIISKTSRPDIHKTGALEEEGQHQSADSAMQKDVAEEMRLREDEAQAKRERAEMRRLSSDVGTGLRVGGGGARAMMRQLEQAEQAERRARLERRRSSQVERTVEEPRPMGAVPDEPCKPFTAPERLTSPFLEKMDPLKDRPTRTPSPLLRMLSVVRDEVSGSSSSRASTSSSTDQTQGDHKGQKLAKRPEYRHEAGNEELHKSSSPLVKREISLGIPLQIGPSARSQTQWHSSASSLASHSSSSDSPAMSHKPIHAHSRTATSSSTDHSADAENNAIRLARAQSLNAPRRSSPLSQEAKVSPSSGTAAKERLTHSQAPESQAGNNSANGARFRRTAEARRSKSVDLSRRDPQLSDTSADHAKPRARNSIRGFVARMRS